MPEIIICIVSGGTLHISIWTNKWSRGSLDHQQMPQGDADEIAKLQHKITIKHKPVASMH